MKVLTANLPDKLSDIILIALEDLRKAERSKKYKINMGMYHEPNGACSVCFAGAVMAQCEGAKPTESLKPANFNRKDYGSLRALDSLRLYMFSAMFRHHLDIEYGQDLPSNIREVADELTIYFGDYYIFYEECPTAFKQNMETVAAILQEHNL